MSDNHTSKPSKARLDILVSHEEYQLLKKYCALKCRSQSDVIREAIRRLKRYVDEEA